MRARSEPGPVAAHAAGAVDPRLLALADRVLAPARALASPVFVGLDRVPGAGPLMFVGNHTLFALLDIPFLFVELARRRGLVLRALVDHVHFRVPVWRRLLGLFGAVDGTQEQGSALLRAGEALLVFPGGAREVAKRRGEENTIVWGSRTGFARLAMAHGCTIVPFAQLGVEDAFDVVFDGDDLLRGPLGPILRGLRVRPDLLFPLVRGLGPTPLPRPERLYFGVGEPIDARDFTSPRALRDEAEARVTRELRSLEALRDADPERRLSDRLRARIAAALSGL